jgi:glycosyltransferase involved in cell wall biosynthesis
MIDPVMDDWPTISVVIPTYNRAALIGEAIASVVDQQYPHLEIIVVDDGSTDETEQVVRAISLGNEGSRAPTPALHYIKQANGGPSRARNHGIAVATGELIAFLDSDDLYLPGKLAAQAHVFRDLPQTRLAFSWFDIADDEGRTRLGRRTALRGEVARELLARCMQGPIATPTVMARRSALVEAGGFDETMRLSEDIDLWCRVARLGPIELVPEVFVRVRRHSGNLSRGPDRTAYLAAARRIIGKAQQAEPDAGRLFYLGLLAKAHLWSWLIGIGRLLPAAVSFWLRALITNPVALLRRRASRQKTTNNSAVHVGEAVAPSLKFVSQPLVVDPQQVHDRRVQVVNVQPVAGDVVAQFVGQPED